MFFYKIDEKKKNLMKDLASINIVENHVRVSKTMLILTILITAATTALIAVGKASEGLTYFSVAYAVLSFGIVMTANYFILRNAFARPWSKYVMTVSIMLLVTICRVVSPSHETVALIYVGIVLTLLYNDVKLIVFTGGLYLVSDIVLQAAIPSLRLASSSDYAIRYFTILFACVASIAGSKGINRLFSLAEKNEREALDAKSTIEQTFTQIQSAVAVLNENTSRLKNEIGQTKSAIDLISVSFGQISSGIDSSTRSVVEITEFTVDSNKILEKVNGLSSQVGQEYNRTAGQVNEGSSEMAEMSRNMQVIEHGVKSLNTTVSALKDHMKDIDGFLQSIVGISAQTNLLALNAAIEAARAGESGRGFAVVADEIRKLADDTSKTVSEIQDISVTIQKSTENAMQEVRQSTEAVLSGKDRLGSIMSKFGSITDSVNHVNEKLNSEVAEVGHIRRMYLDIQSRLEGLSSVFEEHTATTQEIMAAVNMQAATMENILNQIGNIDQMSQKLNQMANR